MCLPGESARLKPRLVNAWPPKRQLITGPFDKQYADIIRKRFSIKARHAAVWVNGPQVEEFGSWCDDAIAELRTNSPNGVVYFRWGDHKAFEAHRPAEAQRFEDICQGPDVDPDYAECARAAYRVRGRGVRLPVQFEVENVLCSGGTETSNSSAKRNSAALRHVFGEAEWGVSVYAFNGDDWLTMSTEPFSESLFHERMLDLGLESEYEESENFWDVEFCQSIPYPVQGQTVWGPKIGRVLARLPYTTTSTKEDPRGVAKGMLHSCSHIPFLRQYLDYIIELSPGVKAVEYKYHVVSSKKLDAASDTWAFVNYRYGLNRGDLDQYVTILRSVSVLGAAVNWELGLSLLERDE